MSEVLLIDPGDNASFAINWSDVLDAGVTVSSVVHTLPSPLVKGAESTVSPNSYVSISGAVHGKIYMIEGAATLSTGEVLNRQFPLRCFNG
jgi:hypothetical protein